MIANMRYRLAVALGYFALGTWFVYGVVDRGDNVSEAAGILIGFVLPVVLGVLIGRWWALLLPVGVFLISIPAGYSADSSLEVPVWFLEGIWQAIAIPLVLIGILARRLAEYMVVNRAARGSRSVRGTVPPAASRK